MDGDTLKTTGNFKNNIVDMDLQARLWKTLARLGLKQYTLEYSLYDSVYGRPEVKSVVVSSVG